MCRARSVLVVAAGWLSLVSPARGAGKEVKKVDVVCPKASVQAALDASSGPVEIVIRGWCAEHVVVGRAGVTLRGATGDPTADGITGWNDATNTPVDLEGDLGLVQIEDAARGGAKSAPSPVNQSVVLVDLGVRDSPGIGVMTTESAIGLRNVRVTGSSGLGVYLTSTSFGVVDGLVASGNGGGGVRANRESTINCGFCTLESNGGWAATASNEGKIALYDTADGASYLSGPRGANAFYGGRVFLYPGTEVIATAGQALWAVQSGAVESYGAVIDGPVWCGIHGQLYSTGLEQRSNAGLNNFYTECAAQFEGGASDFVGSTLFHANATGVIFDGSASFDTLGCQAGGDFFCNETPGTVTKTSSTCGGCP